MRRLLTSAILLAAAITAAHAGGDPIAPKAGTWKTWVIASGRAFRVAAPPNEAATTAEIGALNSLATKREAAAKDLIASWNVGPPSYRWHDIALREVLRNALPWNDAIRDCAVLHVAIDDALVAAWDSKDASNRQRPSEVDGRLATAWSHPRSPSYPAAHAVAAGAAAAVLASLFPERAASCADQADEAGRSRVSTIRVTSAPGSGSGARLPRA